jgi:hypothetical protein
VTTVALLRQNYVNRHVGRADGSTIPWSDTDIDGHITQALALLWPEFGKFAAGSVATSQNSDVYTIPSALTGGRISRIELEYASGGQSTLADRISSWRYYSDTQVRIRPLLPTDATLSLRFTGWVPFATNASDLPVRLEPAIAARAAGYAMGQLAGQLVNYQRQQGLDNGRVVDYPTAVGLAAYWERRYFEQIENDPVQTSYAPRRASR